MNLVQRLWKSDSYNINAIIARNELQTSDIKNDIRELKLLTEKLNEKDRQLKQLYKDYELIFNFIPDVAIIFDKNGYIKYLNSIAKETCNCYIGMYWKDFLKILGVPLEKSTFKKAIETNKECKNKFYIKEKDKYIYNTSKPIFSNGSLEYLMFISRDITEVSKYDNEIKYKNKLLYTVTEISNTLIQKDLTEETAKNILSKLKTVTNVDRVYIFENNKDNTETSQKYIVQDNCTIDIKNLQNVPYSLIPRWKEYMELNHIICGNLHDFPKEEQDFLKPKNIKSICCVPIFYKEQWKGFLGFDRCIDFKTWSFDEEIILKITADILGNIIYKEI